ncbi:hypothetical protein CAJAP_02052 [Camponotus japonicus]
MIAESVSRQAQERADIDLTMLQQVSRHQLSWFTLQDGYHNDDDDDDDDEKEGKREGPPRGLRNEAGMKTHPRRMRVARTRARHVMLFGSRDARFIRLRAR